MDALGFRGNHQGSQTEPGGGGERNRVSPTVRKFPEIQKKKIKNPLQIKEGEKKCRHSSRAVSKEVSHFIKRTCHWARGGGDAREIQFSGHTISEFKAGDKKRFPISRKVKG